MQAQRSPLAIGMDGPSLTGQGGLKDLQPRLGQAESPSLDVLVPVGHHCGQPQLLLLWGTCTIQNQVRYDTDTCLMRILECFSEAPETFTTVMQLVTHKSLICMHSSAFIGQLQPVLAARADATDMQDTHADAACLSTGQPAHHSSRNSSVRQPPRICLSQGSSGGCTAGQGMGSRVGRGGWCIDKRQSQAEAQAAATASHAWECRGR